MNDSGQPEICIVTPRFFPHLGGVETHIRETTNCLRGSYKFSVLTSDPTGREPASDLIDGIKIKRCTAYPGGRDWLIAPGILFNFFKKNRADLIHFQSIATAVCPLGMIGAILSHQKFVVSFHTGGHSSNIRKRMRFIQWWLLRPLLNRAEALIAVSRFERDMFARVLKIDPSRIDLIPNGSEIPRTAEGISGISGPKPLILSVGRLEEYKGHHRAVRAMPMILKSLPAARMLIVGRGPFEKNLRKLIVDLGLEESVSITSYGGEERTEYSDLLRMADLVVLLSEYEAHPIAVMEAVAVGTPVVGAATSGFIELGEERVIDVVDLESGQDEIAQAMITALARGRREPQCYTWSQCASGIQSIYERVLQRGSASK